jgi:hypothetical protein
MMETYLFFERSDCEAKSPTTIYLYHNKTQKVMYKERRENNLPTIPMYTYGREDSQS